MFPTIPADLSSLSVEELAALLDEARTAYAAARAADNITPENVQALTEFAAAVGTIRAEQASRTGLSDEQRAALAAADAVFETTPADPAAAPDAPADDADAEPGDPDAEDPDPEESLSSDQIVDLINTSVAAALSARPARTRQRPASPATIAELAARVNAEQAPLPRPLPAPFSIVAAADVPGHSIGSNFTGRADLAEAMLRRSEALGHGSGGPDDKVYVASFNVDRGAERTLSGGDYSAENDRKIREYREEREEAIVAAGGLCAPVNNRYEQMVISEAWRPVFGGPVPSFNVDRGGLKQIPPPALADITSGVATITAAADLTGGTGAVKACFSVTCASSTEDDVEADYVCLQFGNFGARTFPEQVDAWMELAAAAHARLAEGNRLTDIKSKSIATSAAGLVGAGREILTRVEQQAQVINSAQRRPSDAPMEVILPQWAFPLIRADFTRTLTDDIELIGVTDQEIAAWFAARHLMVTLTPDSATGNSQVIAAEAGGVINEYPSTVVGDIFVPGTFLGLDNGRLDLGLVRDSALTMGSGGTAGNQFRMFYESFEGLTKVGPAGSSVELTMTVCADGTYGAAKAVTCPIVT